MASREFSVAFRINGALNGSFASAMQAAQAAMQKLSSAASQVNAAMAQSSGTLSGYLQRLNKIAADSAKFAQLKSLIPKTQGDLQAQIAQTRQLAQAYQQQKAQVESFKASLKSLQSQQAALKNSYNTEKAALTSLKNQLTGLKSAYDSIKASAGKNSTQVQQLKSQIDALKASIESQKATVQNAKSAWDMMKASVKQAGAELKLAEANLKSLGANFDSSKSKVKSLYDQLKNQKAQLESLKSSLSGAGFSTDHFIQSEMKLRSEIEATNRAIQEQTQLAGRLSSAQGRVNDASSNFSEAQNAFNTVTSAIDTIAAPIKKSIETSVSFEASMSRVKALTQSQNIREGNYAEVERQMALLTAQAKELGATTQFTAIQAADAMGYLGMAGWKTPQILGTMPGMLNLAAAAGADLAQTADIVSDNMTAMGVPVEQAGHFMDVYAYALTNSNARLSDFGQTMKYAAPVAKAYGASLDETAAMVMMMANAGIKGTMAGTSLRMGLLRLAGPPKAATKEMQALGLSLSDAQAGALEAEAVIKSLGIDLNGAVTPGEKMTRVLMQLHEKTKDLSQDEKLSAFKAIFGVNAETGWLALFDQGPEVFARYVEGLKNADGYSKQVADTMIDNTQGAITIMNSAIEGAYLAVGEALSPAVRSVVEGITPLISGFAQWAEQNPAIIQGIVGIIAVLGVLATAATGAMVAFAGWEFITAQLALFRAGMAATEVTGLGFAARLGAAFTSLRVAIAGLSFSSVAAGVSSAFSAMGAAIMGAARAAMAFVMTPLGAALTALAILAYVVYQNWDKIRPAIQGALDAISGAVDRLMAALAPIGEAISNAFSGLGNIDVGFTDTMVSAFLLIVHVVAGVATSIINIFTATISTITDMWNGLGDVISAALDFDFDKMGAKAFDLSQKIKSDWSNINFSSLDFGYDIGGEFAKSKQIYQQAQLQSQSQIKIPEITPQQGGIFSQAAQLMPQSLMSETPQQPVDTTPIIQGVEQAGQALQQVPQAVEPLQQLPQSIEPASQALQQLPQAIEPVQTALSEFPQSIEPVKEALSQFPEALTPVTEALAQFPQSLEPVNQAFQGISEVSTAARDSVQQLGESAQAAQETIQQLGEAAGNAAPQVDSLGQAAGNAAGNVAALGEAAGPAAGNVSALGSAAQSVVSALQSAAAQISSIKITVPTITVASAAANYKGGIYNKGAFLTWFAERSPEAAIPLDKSARAVQLWTQAGQILGTLPSDGSAPIPAEKPTVGSTQREIMTVQREKLKRAQEVYNAVTNQTSSGDTSTDIYQNSTLKNMWAVVSNVSSVQNRVQELQAAQFDELGNIIGLNGAEGNVITKYDNDKIKHVKQAAQIKEYREKQSRLESTTKEISKTSWIDRVKEKFGSVYEKIFGKTQETRIKEEVPTPPVVLTESQRYRSEDVTKEKTLEKIQNSRSYQAIVNAQRNVNRNSTSILNRGELQTKIATDETGGIIGRIFGTDFGLGRIATSGTIGEKKLPPEIMRPTPTFPENQSATSTLPPEIMRPTPTFPENQSATSTLPPEIMRPTPTFPENQSATSTLPPEIYTQHTSTIPTAKNPAPLNLPTEKVGGLDLGGLFGGIDKAIGGINLESINLGGIFGGSPNIRQPQFEFPNINAVGSPALSEKLESVSKETSAENYSSAAFNPTFNITVTVSGNGENIDTKAVGEQIAFSARESFEKEFAKFKHEQSRRGFA